jgi:hypothetical protein
MSAGWILVGFLVVLVIVPVTLGLAVDALRGRSGASILLTADNARAKATLAYYSDVHDSHSG